MAKRPKERGPYKKYLSVFELRALAEEHKGGRIFTTNKDGERALRPWLKELRFEQALEVAQRIRGRPIDEQTFQECWARTPDPEPQKKQQGAPPNTATFGGYRHRRRPALDRDKKQSNKPRKKEKHW
jgi:hypothetical protein